MSAMTLGRSSFISSTSFPSAWASRALRLVTMRVVSMRVVSRAVSGESGARRRLEDFFFTGFLVLDGERESSSDSSLMTINSTYDTPRQAHTCRARLFWTISVTSQLPFRLFYWDSALFGLGGNL